MYENYHVYLQSEDWMKLRRRVLERDEYKCHLCGNRANRVHHLSYQNIYNEDLDDLVGVCEGCHQGIHDWQKATKQKRMPTRRELDRFLLVQFLGPQIRPFLNGW